VEYILRLPPVIGKRRVEQLASRARAEVGALSGQQRTVHHFVVRELPRHGRAMAPEMIAVNVGLQTQEVTAILDYLEAKKGFLFRNNEGTLLWSVKWVWPGLELAEELAGDVAFQAPFDLTVGLSVGSSWLLVGAGVGVVAEPGANDGVQGSVELAVTVAVEPVACHSA